jgi:hypothetical protein
MKSVKIRYNTNYPKTSDKKWRLLIANKEQKDYVQHLVDEIELKRPCFTSEDVVIGDDGNYVKKFHISTLAQDIIFETQNSLLTAIVI